MPQYSAAGGSHAFQINVDLLGVITAPLANLESNVLLFVTEYRHPGAIVANCIGEEWEEPGYVLSSNTPIKL